MAMIPEDVADIIHAAGLAYKTPVGPNVANMWGNTMGPSPDTAVGLYQSSGFEPERAMGRVAQEVVNLQVITRAKLATDAYNLSMAIFALIDQRKETRGGYHYTILARHMPHTIGEDENRRAKWSCNYRVSRELAV